MENKRNLKELTAEISGTLLDLLSMVDIFKEIVDIDRKEDFLLSSMQKNIHKAFNDIEICREMITFPD